MFARKAKVPNSSADELNRKKCASKVLDVKKDLNSRLRYLKQYIESTENTLELKKFFDVNYSQIYFVFYESFLAVESNIKPKVNKLNKEELETVLFVFHKILLLQPEKVHLRWQVRSIGRIIQKLLHIGNTKSIKFYGARFFLIWYQILNTNKTHVEELMFQKLIQGFDTFYSSAQTSGIINSTMGIDMLSAEAQKVFNQSSGWSANGTDSASSRSIYPFEINPIIPVQPNEQQQSMSSYQQMQQMSSSSSSSQQQQQASSQFQGSQFNSGVSSVYNLTAEMLKKMLEFMQQDCLTIEWQEDKLNQSQRCYEFLFEEFKRFYLAYMFPSAFIINSVRSLHYNQSSSSSSQATTTTGNTTTQQTAALNVYSNNDLLTLLNEQPPPTFERPFMASMGNLTPNDERKLTQLHCKEEIIKWLVSVLLIEPSTLSTAGPSLASLSDTVSYQSSVMTSTNGSFDTVSSSYSLTSRGGDSDTLKAGNQDDLLASLNDFDSSLFDTNFLQPLSTAAAMSASAYSNSTTAGLTSSSSVTGGASQTAAGSQISNTNKQLIQRVILSSMSNVNLVHEILRNTYFLNFEDYTTIQQVLSAYKKWFLKETIPPSFMNEPPHTSSVNAYHQMPATPNSIFHAADLLSDTSMSMSIGGGMDMDDGRSNWSEIDQGFQRTPSLSISAAGSNIVPTGYSGAAIFGEQTRVGYMRCLQIFFLHSSNLLLNRTNLQRDKIKNICCYTLDIYKMFIRKIKMDNQTWTLLISILLRVADFLFNSEYLINNRTDPATSHLIKLITETVLLAIIKATFSFNLSIEIWDQLMSLLSSVNSYSDVVDKWIEVIEDLMRQVLKSVYNIDINNLPIVETSHEQKRKLKKKHLTQQPNNFSPSAVTQTPITTTSGSNIQQQQQAIPINAPIVTKSRARTEIYPPSYYPSSLPSSSSSNNNSTANGALNLHSTTQQPGAAYNNNNMAPGNMAVQVATTSISTATTVNNSASSSNTASPVQPLLTRQPSTKIQNTFRDDTYLHTLGNIAINDLETTTKSPSLSEEHFLAINNSTETKPPSSCEPANTAANDSNYSTDSSSNNRSSASRHESMCCGADDELNDGDDECGDKSATLKAANADGAYSVFSNGGDFGAAASATNSATTQYEKTMNRFSSDKSIYYSSEVLAENNNNSNNSTTLHDTSNNDSNNSSSNTSGCQYPNNSSSFTTPPPLPPLPQTIAAANHINIVNNNTNNTHGNGVGAMVTSCSFPTTSLTMLSKSPPLPPTPISSQPPPLPPLPPSLASKYFINKSLNLDHLTVNTSSDQGGRKSALNSGGVGAADGTSALLKHENSNANNESLTDRHSKSGSEYDTLMKDLMNTSNGQLDTASEAASMSGGELSGGELFASPNVSQNNSNSSNSTLANSLANVQDSTSSLQSSLLLQPTITLANQSSAASAAASHRQLINGSRDSGISSTLTYSSNASAANPFDHTSSNGLLALDQRSNDERSASFIDSKYLVKEHSTSLRSASITNTPNNIPNSNSVNNFSLQHNSAPTVGRAQPQPAETSSSVMTNFESAFKETAFVLIKRLFGCVGNVNGIKDPLIHKRVFEFIYNKWELFGKVKDNLKLPELANVVPPLSDFSPWLFEAIYQLPVNFQIGKEIAFKTLCRIGIRSANTQHDEFDSVNEEFMDLFYLTIHQGLRSDDKRIINCIIQNCGTKFWHCMLPSSTLLIKDFIDACSSITSQEAKYDAASILGCLIGFPDYFGDMKLLNLVSPSASSPSPQNSPQGASSSAHSSSTSSSSFDENLTIDVFSKEELKNQIIHSLTTFSDEPTNTNSRCVVLCALTCYIYDEITNQRFHPRLNEAIKRIFKDLDSRDHYHLIKMSCDNLRFLSILANPIFQWEIQYAINIINELNQCLVKLINSRSTMPANLSEDYEKAIISNMFALLEWCMNMPLEQLKDQDRATLLRNNFKLIIHICNTFKPGDSIESEHIHLSARFIISHLLTQLNHFPLSTTGPSKIVSSVNETSDLNLSIDELSTILFEQSNIQFFTVNNQFLISFIELSMQENEMFFNLNSSYKTSSTICRFIVRDFCGKNCWDCCLLHPPDENRPPSYFIDLPTKKLPSDKSLSSSSSPSPLKSGGESRSRTMSDAAEMDSSPAEAEAAAVDQSSTTTFDFAKLPFVEFNEIPKDIDILDNILQYISHSSPECRLDPNRPLNILWDLNSQVANLLNVDDIKQRLSNQDALEQKNFRVQREIETSALNARQQTNAGGLKDASPFSQATAPANESYDSPNNTPLSHYFHLCKSFVHQMGLLSWEKRQSFNLLRKTPQLLRELKSLDDQTCRETHKIAVIYIAEGQDERLQILSNERGSQDYEDFLNALAWPVDLESHEGFMGGLQHNNQLKTAPYYANSISEVLFHVSTQMNNPNDPNKISKWRHLGNDSVQIIWSEHSKDYDRNILATEFADVIICIYPLKNGLYRIQIIKKLSVGFFGPLFDGAIISKQSLPTLIRATAMNASRVLLSNTKGYQDFYVHRAHAINNIIRTLTEKQTFEQFISDIYSPAIGNPTQPLSTSQSNGGGGQSATIHPALQQVSASSQMNQSMNLLRKDYQESEFSKVAF